MTSNRRRRIGIGGSLEAFAHRVTGWAGSWWAFGGAVGVIILWVFPGQEPTPRRERSLGSSVVVTRRSSRRAGDTWASGSRCLSTVSTEMREEVYQFLSLFPQPTRTRPAVEYVPMLYRARGGSERVGG
jgi:Serine dehydrogenase proteinase